MSAGSGFLVVVLALRALFFVGLALLVAHALFQVLNGFGRLSVLAFELAEF